MLSRRQFMRAAAAGAVSIVAGRSALALESRKRIIVDAQCHVWKAESADWKWVPGMRPQLPEPFTIEKLVPMMDEAGVDRVVVVPPSWPGDRNDYVLEAARRYPMRFAAMGHIPLQDPRAAALLPAWRAQPGMLGVRLSFVGPEAKWATNGTADWFWPAAEYAGIPVMFLSSGQGPAFAKIAERYPRLTLIIDHLGVTRDDVQAGRIDDAIHQTVALAKYPNVSVKLSSTPGMSSQSYPFLDVSDYIHRVFDAYGPQRCYWGTDMTNSFARATYRQRVTQFTEELPFLSEDDKDWIMGRAILERLRWS
jgi:predicted TIM-barrel fold metal-dependent hydrolase